MRKRRVSQGFHEHCKHAIAATAPLRPTDHDWENPSGPSRTDFHKKPSAPPTFARAAFRSIQRRPIFPILEMQVREARSRICRGTLAGKASTPSNSASVV
jgi:hypothetical protein